MGTTSTTQAPHFIQRKRQNHALLGEISLVECPQTHRMLTRKCVKMQKMAKLASYIGTLTYQSEQPFVQIHSIIQSKPSFSLTSCTADSDYTILMDCVEIDMQTLQLSKKFSQKQIINMISCVVLAIIELSKHKIGILPISKKTIIYANGKDEYKGQDPSTAVFKVIPSPYSILLQNNNFSKLNDYSSNQRQCLFSQSPFYDQVFNLGILVRELLAQNQLQNFHQSFSNQHQSAIQNCSLFNLLNRMVEKDVRKRISKYELKQQIQKMKLSNIYNKNSINIRLINCHLGINPNHLQIKKMNSKQIYRSEPSTARFSQKLKTNTEQCKSSRKQNLYLHYDMHTLNENCSPQFNRTLRNIQINKECFRIQKNSHKSFTKNNQSLGQQKPLRIMFQNGAFYEGGLDEDQNFNGFGTLFYSRNQICYTGYWKNNAFHGFGYLYNTKDTDQSDSITRDSQWEHYEGQFQNDLKHGYGRLYFQDGTVFEGEFVNDKPKMDVITAKRKNQFDNLQFQISPLNDPTYTRSKTADNFY